ncbi:FkbM family methyltransferase [Pedobacter roseus]|uniref:FkbM family methyltransferase n=1 Tax=Pedobacter roseus TaxID=336820 RepID=A0A7G9QI44_9SPHI|nr:FkbM family methyltransferase [Pedobacter roseus]QNN43019.1 FkbM family methyltransferase [Pedobacter roseus]
MFKKLISKLIPAKFVQKLRNDLGVPSQRKSLEALKKLGFSPNYVLDIGAYEGNWAIEFNQIFPESKIMMIEGQRQKHEILLQKKKLLPNSEVKIALLGAENKTVNFNIYDTASSIYKEDNETGALIEEMELQLLDDILLTTAFCKPDFIKIDTQGFELEILKGAAKTLQSAKAVLLEVSFLNIYKGAPLASEVIAFMKKNSFVVYDICSLMRRPYDRALFQSDFLFLQKDFNLRSSTRWA